MPQGSILGPTLFLLYLNDIGNVSWILKSVLFADDINFFCSGTDVAELNTKVSNELAKLKFWFAANKLSLNIDRVNKTKLRVVFIDENLTWKEHVIW